MTLDDPVFVVSALKLQEGLAQFLHGAESPHPEQVFFEDADKALGAAVAFRRPDKSGGAGDSQKGNFFLEIVRHILAAVVVSQGQALGGMRREGAEVFPHPLLKGFQGLEAGTAFGGMKAHALHGAVIHGKEDSRLALFSGKSRGHIRAPHVVDPGSGDGAVMDPGSGGASPAVGSQELMVPHQAQDPSFRGPEAGISQPGPHLAVSFSMKRGLGQDGFDVLHQVMISTWPSRSWSRCGAGWFRFGETLPIHRGAPQAPNVADPDHKE